MASKPKDKKFPRKTVQCIAGETDDETGRNLARLTTSPELAAFRAISAAEERSNIGEHIDVPTLMEQLRDQAAAVNRNDLTHAEAMLMNQATALQSLFSRLTEKAMGADCLPHFEVFMRMALRAQNQCRSTLETLAAIKNPQPVAFVRQANIAHGPQQVNNGTLHPSESPRARENEIEQNKLLEDKYGERLDTGTAKTAGGFDQDMATVGPSNRANDSGR